MISFRELKKLSAAQFMEVWNHYDSDGENILDHFYAHFFFNWAHPGATDIKKF